VLLFEQKCLNVVWCCYLNKLNKRLNVSLVLLFEQKWLNVRSVLLFEQKWLNVRLVLLFEQGK